ncbi:MAG: universal stress protein [Sphingobacteriales bacterium]|nr:MAG: universal stress protein [Sphingobacteriales bacterium]
MKHILIPTDFTIKSLQAVKAAADHFHDERIKITLFHLLELPFGIGDMLFRLNSHKNSKLIDADFTNACQIIQNKYHSSIESIDTVFGQGSTVSYLSNVLDGLDIDLIFLQQNLKLTQPDKRSINVVPMLYKTNYKIIEVAGAQLSEKVNFSIADLLVQSTSFQ